MEIYVSAMIVSMGNVVRFTVWGIKDKGSHYACSSLLLLVSLSVFPPDLPVLEETLQYSAFISFASSMAWFSIWDNSLSFCLKGKKRWTHFRDHFSVTPWWWWCLNTTWDCSEFHCNYFLLFHCDRDHLIKWLETFL